MFPLEEGFGEPAHPPTSRHLSPPPLRWFPIVQAGVGQRGNCWQIECAFQRFCAFPGERRETGKRPVNFASISFPDYRWRDSNPHGAFAPTDFKSVVSAISPHRRVL